MDASTRITSAKLPLLAVLFVASVAVLFKAVSIPKPPKGGEPAPFLKAKLPEAVPLPGWQLVGSKPLTSLDPKKSGEVVGRSYEYKQGNQVLRVDIRPQSGDGNVGRFLNVASEVKEGNVKLKAQYNPQIGNFGVLPHKERLYLTACINPRGKSTLTNPEFQQNRYSNDLRPGRILPWLVGQTDSVFDERCLFTLMSMPLPPNPEKSLDQVQDSYVKMEAAWGPLQQWLQANYPPES